MDAPGFELVEIPHDGLPRRPCRLENSQRVSTRNTCWAARPGHESGHPLAVHLPRSHCGIQPWHVPAHAPEWRIARANDRITFGKPHRHAPSHQDECRHGRHTHTLRCLVYDFARDFDVDPHNEVNVDEGRHLQGFIPSKPVKTCSDEMLEIFGGDSCPQKILRTARLSDFVSRLPRALRGRAPTVQRITIGARECQRLKAQLGYQD